MLISIDTPEDIDQALKDVLSEMGEVAQPVNNLRDT